MLASILSEAEERAIKTLLDRDAQGYWIGLLPAATGELEYFSCSSSCFTNTVKCVH